MWTVTHTGETAASADRVFALFKDVATWPKWNAGVERIDLDGPFATGTTGTMVVADQGALEFRLVWVAENAGFEDETPIAEADVVVRVRHTLQPKTDGGTRIEYRCVIEGPGADLVGPDIGPAITSDFPDVILALAERAQAAIPK